MKKETQPKPEAKKGVLIVLSQADYERLTEICMARHQSRADFLRGAMDVHEAIPLVNTRKLQGACLQKHLARLEREKQEKRTGKV